MRYDINILWIDDEKGWQSSAEEIFRLNIEKYGILTDITRIDEEIDSLPDKIKSESNGYKIYDIIFVDYNISNKNNGITGDFLIDEFRKNEIDADVLFYSERFSNNEILEEILKSKDSLGGVYLADRDSFNEIAFRLYKKNIRKLMSLFNIRGFLTDKTSECDYIVNSYILEKYEIHKKELSKKVNELLFSEIGKVNENIKKIKKQEWFDVKQLMRLPSYIFPLANKYILFECILRLESQNYFSNETTVKAYLNDIVKLRNNVAHKKVDICKQQKYLKYYDNIKQYNERQCGDCNNHTDENKIALKDWEEKLKLVNKYSELFDKILTDLNKNKEILDENYDSTSQGTIR